MRWAAGILIVMATGVVPAYAANSGSNQWIDKRVELWRHVCLDTSPSFKGTGTALKRNGFVKRDGDMYSYKDTEVVASVRNTENGCRCSFSFGTRNPDLGVMKLGKVLVDLPPSRFSAKSGSGSFGDILAPDGPARVSVVRFDQAGVPWVGVIIQNKRPCPGV